MTAKNKTMKPFQLKDQLSAELKSVDKANFALKTCLPACRATSVLREQAGSMAAKSEAMKPFQLKTQCQPS